MKFNQYTIEEKMKRVVIRKLPIQTKAENNKTDLEHQVLKIIVVLKISQE